MAELNLPPLPTVFSDEEYELIELIKFAEAVEARERIFRERIAELEADAARYRWLRDNWHNVCTATGLDGRGDLCVAEIFIGAGEHEPFKSESLDAAIDAAMRGANDRT